MYLSNTSKSQHPPFSNTHTRTHFFSFSHTPTNIFISHTHLRTQKTHRRANFSPINACHLPPGPHPAPICKNLFLKKNLLSDLSLAQMAVVVVGGLCLGWQVLHNCPTIQFNGKNTHTQGML
jgi:hypothetical protein